MVTTDGEYQARQKPKLGGVRVSHRPYIHAYILFQLSVLTRFHCITLARFIFLLSFCVFEKLSENPKIFPYFFSAFSSKFS